MTAKEPWPEEQGDAPPTGFPEAFTNSFRGMILGGLLGDVRNPGADVLHSGPVAPQSCWTLDSLVRHRLHVRARERHDNLLITESQPAPTPHIRRGLLRWGALTRHWPNVTPPNGWLSNVSALAIDRGPTPAEDSARDDLMAERALSRNDHRTSSALFRTLPIAASSVLARPEVVAGWCATAAGLTHGHPESWNAAALLGVLVGGHLAEVFRSGPWVRLDALASVKWFSGYAPEHPLLDTVVPALTDQQWSPATLAELAPDDTSAAVLAGALYLFRHARDRPPQLVREMAASAGAPHAVASLTTALIGLERGPGGLDTVALSRHELAWAMDSLARDYCVTLWSPPNHEGEMDVLGEMSLRYPEHS